MFGDTIADSGPCAQAPPARNNHAASALEPTLIDRLVFDRSVFALCTVESSIGTPQVLISTLPFDAGEVLAVNAKNTANGRKNAPPGGNT
jgi:hypothetical protein